jgi:glycosyltransferase involved in cell wall biosynthesis
MKFTEKAAKANRIFREKGLTGIGQSFRRLYRNFEEKRKYQKWIKAHRIDDEKRLEIRNKIESFRVKPKISVVMPVYNVDEKWLRLCVESVINQLYENWELCIADDASPSAHIKKVLEEYAAKDARIKLVFRPQNGHISAASNSALELATGEFAALLDHDDELSEDALFWATKEINDFPETEMIYSDEDLIDERGRRYEPKFKPDWSRDLFYSLNLITHLSIYKTAVLRKIGGFRIGAEGSQDYDLAMRVVEEIPEKNIRHIPKILYHWRAIRGSVAFSSDEKPYAHERAREALRAHFERTGKRATVSEAVYNLHRTRYDLPENPPKVCLIFSADENFDEQMLKNFIEQTDYGNFEIVLIVSATETNSPANVENTFPNSPKIKTIAGEDKSEAERLNFAAAQTDAEILCFIEADLKPIAADWLAELTSFAIQKEIGAVGAKLLYKDETVLHGGLIVGANGAVGIAHHRISRDSGGSFLRARLVNNFSAVSVSCLAVRHEVFDSVGGFDAENLPNKFFDADFCLRLREKNYRIVFTPYAELIQIDEKKGLNPQRNADADEKVYFLEKWRSVARRDSFYNPNFSKKDASFSIDV